MRTGKKVAWVGVTLICGAITLFPACGGGGGSGGGGGGAPAFIALNTAGGNSPVSFGGSTVGGAAPPRPYPVLPVELTPGPTLPPVGVNYSAIAPPIFPTGNVGDQFFIELSFNNFVDASTVFSNPPNSASDGIVVFRNDEVPVGSGNIISTPVRFVLDPTGIVTPSNSFPNAGVAPQTLRIYFDTDGNLGAGGEEYILPGSYTLTINAQRLKASNGSAFLLESGRTDYQPVMPFSIVATGQMDPAPFTLNFSNPSVPVQNDPQTKINSEIILNFSKAVNFGALVGATNLSTLDPFVSLPRPLLEADCNTGVFVPAFMNIGNLFIAYTPPTDLATMTQETLPANLGVVVYMPDPFLNPTQVRIRFVNMTNLQGVDTCPTGPFQNYASNPQQLRIRSTITDPNNALNCLRNSGTNVLSLPAIQPVPGSLPGYNPTQGAGDLRAAVVDVVVVSANFMYASPPFPPIPMMGMQCYMSTGGAADRSGNFLQADYQLKFVYEVGPQLARNPMPPDATFVGTTQAGLRGIGVINTAPITSQLGAPMGCPPVNSQAPVTYGTTATGSFRVEPNRLANTSVLGTPLDIEVGHWLLTQMFPGQGVNFMSNPGRSAAFSGIPDTQNLTTPCGLLDIIGATMPPTPPLQPWGNFLYVVDGDAKQVKIFNSYNFSQIGALTGIANPAGLGISPNLEFLWVSTFSANGVVSRVFTNPTIPAFHTVSNTVQVGSFPTKISVAPSNEDVFVINSGSNQISIIDATTVAQRHTLSDPAMIGPDDIHITLRMLGVGLTNAYMAFINNFFSNSVTVYESDSPAVPENGQTGLIKSTSQGFEGPSRGTWNWQTYIGFTAEPGCFIPNTLGTTVDEFTMFNFMLGPMPGFPGPPPRRDFHVLKAFSSAVVMGAATRSPSDAAIDNHSGLYNVGVAGATNNKSACDPTVGGGIPSVVLVSYPSVGIVAAFDYRAPALLGQASVPGCDFLQTYYDQ